MKQFHLLRYNKSFGDYHPLLHVRLIAEARDKDHLIDRILSESELQKEFLIPDICDIGCGVYLDCPDMDDPNFLERDKITEEPHYDVTFIGIKLFIHTMRPKTYNDRAMKILKEDRKYFNNFFNSYDAELNDGFYLLGESEEEANKEIEKIKKHYKKRFHKMNEKGVIPYDEHFELRRVSFPINNTPVVDIRE